MTVEIKPNFGVRFPRQQHIRDLKQTLELVRWRRRWQRGSGLRPPPLGKKNRMLSWRWLRSGDERRLFCLRFQWSNLTLFLDFTRTIATFQEVRDLLAVACFEDIIDEDEFLLLWDFNPSKNLDFPYEDYGRFDLDEMDNSECVSLESRKATFRTYLLPCKYQISLCAISCRVIFPSFLGLHSPLECKQCRFLL